MKNKTKFFLLTFIIISFFASSCKKENKNTEPKFTFPLVFQDTIAKDIPDGNYGQITSEIEIPIIATVKDPSKVTIELELEHAWCSDIVVELFSPSGISGGALIRRLAAGAVEDYSDFKKGQFFRFTSGNTIPIDVTPAILIGGDYAPSQGGLTNPAIPLCNLNTYLNNTAVKGIWKIKVYDYAVFYTGRLLSWKVIFNEGAF